MDEGKKRTIELAAEITAPIDQVWKALTDAEEITRWFAPHAQSNPGPEGHIWVS